MGPAEAPAGAGCSAGDIGQAGGVGLVVLYQGRVKLFLEKAMKIVGHGGRPGRRIQNCGYGSQKEQMAEDAAVA